MAGSFESFRDYLLDELSRRGLPQDVKSARTILPTEDEERSMWLRLLHPLKDEDVEQIEYTAIKPGPPSA